MTENTTTGRVAIVTGGSSGIGREAAVRLGRDGYAVAIVYGGNQATAEEAVKEVEQAGGRAIAVLADVADETAVAALFDRGREADRDRGRHREGPAAVPGAPRPVRRRRGRGERSR